VPAELDILQLAARAEFHTEMNFVAARGIIAVHAHGRIREISKIPRPPRMIENNFLVKFFQFRTHEKKRTAA
jgi:hypothetical protein